MKENRQHDAAEEVAAELFRLSERAARDAARLALIAHKALRGSPGDLHGRMSDYISRRDSKGYACEEVRALLQRIATANPEVAKAAQRYARAKENAEARSANNRAQWAEQDRLIAGGMNPDAARARVFGRREGSNVVTFNRTGPGMSQG